MLTDRRIRESDATQVNPKSEVVHAYASETEASYAVVTAQFYPVLEEISERLMSGK